MIRVAIVDDEPLARETTRLVLAAAEDVEVVASCSGVDAPEVLRRDAPDLVFLDVQMPGKDGFDVIAEVGPEEMPAIVFVTAHDRYALAAFDAQPLDYLLKPIDAPRLARALDRARQRLGAARAATLPPRQLLIPDHQGLRVVLLDEITWLEAADNYVAVHAIAAAATPPLLRRTLAALLADLGPGFVRTHRSAAVALAQVLALRPGITDPSSLAYIDEASLLAAAADPEREYVDVILPRKLRIAADYAARATVWTDVKVLAATAARLLR